MTLIRRVRGVLQHNDGISGYELLHALDQDHGCRELKFRPQSERMEQLLKHCQRTLEEKRAEPKFFQVLAGLNPYGWPGKSDEI